MVSSAESPIHDNWKQLVIDSSETDTIVVNRYHKPAMRVLRTSRSIEAERDHEASRMVPDSIFKLYFGGDMDAFFAFGGQVAGRIERVESVRDILTTAWTECQQRLRELGRWASED
jgi:enoyl-[acyl-carrier protein] reductase II